MNTNKNWGFALLIGTMSCTAASAQLGKRLEQATDRVIDRTTNRIETKTTNKVNSTVDKTVDKGMDKVFEPNKNKSTSTSNTSTSTTTTKSSNAGTASSALDNSTQTTKPSAVDKMSNATTSTTSAAIDQTLPSSFVGDLQWEIKRYKDGKMITGGHSLLNVFVKSQDVAVHVLNPDDPAKRTAAYVYNRPSQTVVAINETDGTATKSKAVTKNIKIDFKRGTATKVIDGATCTQYTGTTDQTTVTLWVDESERAALTAGFSSGVGVARPDLDIIPYLGAMKAPVREAVVEDKKKGEKLHLWLNNYSTTTPDNKAFDYSRYELRE